MMKKGPCSKSGFTLVEILTSIGIFLILIPFAASILISTQLLASFSKHKIEAAYAAKQIIETLRQQAAQNGSITAPPAGQPVILDTKGNYNNTSNYFYGTSTVTVTPINYPNNPGANGNVYHVVVNINWNENVANNRVLMTETYAADIIRNDNMLN